MRKQAKREGERLISPLIPQIRRGEKEGDHWAATMLAILYANGIGVEADLAQAKHYYERALEIPTWPLDGRRPLHYKASAVHNSA